MTAHREMLIGIAALQTGCVTYQNLIAALREWSLDKFQSLGAILVRRGSIRVEERELIARLVELRQNISGDDWSENLISASDLRRLAADLADLGDPEMDSEIQALTAAYAPNLESADASDQPSREGSRAVRSRFRILRPHARGGLGEVFVARDEELHRDVALKEIQSKYAGDPMSRGRFLVEAEVTGGLEHPGIVPVYGLGQYPDGRPYYLHFRGTANS